MRGIELFIIFSMAAFDLPVMSWRERADLLVLDPKLRQR